MMASTPASGSTVGSSPWVLGCLSLLLSSSPLLEAAPDAVLLQLPGPPGFQQAGYYRAQAPGFNGDEGLQGSILPGGSQSASIEPVLAGDAQFGVAATEPSLAHLQGHSDVLVTDLSQQHYPLRRQDAPYRVIRPQAFAIDFSADTVFRSVAMVEQSPQLATPNDNLSGFLYSPEARSFDWDHPYARIGIIIAVLLAIMTLVLGYFNRRLRLEVAQRMLMEERLLDSEHRLSLALWGANLGCWDWDLDNNRVHVDERGAQMLGENNVGGEIDLGQPGRSQQLFLSLLEDLETDEVKAERHIKQGGESRWVLLRGKRLRHDAGRSRVFGTLMDVSSDHAYQERLVKLSITDPLTSLLNRRYFYDRLIQSCSQSRRDGNFITLALLDIDHFKEVNDKYGHVAGDETLIQFSEMLKKDCRPYDLVARFGGEEFIILFFGMDKQFACHVLERYQESLRTTQIVADGHRFYCTFSCGISDSSEFGPGLLDANALVKLADERLYYGKQHGRNRIVLDSAA